MAWRLKMEAWRAFRLVVANSHHCEEELDVEPFKMRSWIRIRIEVKSWNRIRTRIKVMRIRNPEILSRIRI
jgi:hypothetical protein